MPGYKMSNKPMGAMKGDAKSGASNERIAMAGAKAADYSKAPMMKSPSGKPAKQ